MKGWGNEIEIKRMKRKPVFSFEQFPTLNLIEKELQDAARSGGNRGGPRKPGRRLSSDAVLGDDLVIFDTYSAFFF
uniref:Uncharacterized protein n=1 Tax=Cucumis melo TaxID=3656 RepID=A0A9I9CYI1_CUCME